MAEIDLGLVVGAQGAQGPQGVQGPQGPGATVTAGTVTTAVYGTPAQVTNSGTATDAVLDFVIPQGAPGESVTDMSSLTLNSVTSSSASYPAFSAGEVGSTIFGKIKKYLSDLKAAVDLKINKSAIINNLLATVAGSPLDATQGKILNDKIITLNDSLTKTNISVAGSATETYTINTTYRHLIACGHSNLTGIRGIWVTFGNNIIPVVEASSVTLSLSSGVLTVTNNTTSSLNGIIL